MEYLPQYIGYLYWTSRNTTQSAIQLFDHVAWDKMNVEERKSFLLSKFIDIARNSKLPEVTELNELTCLECADENLPALEAVNMSSYELRDRGYIDYPWKIEGTGPESWED